MGKFKKGDRIIVDEDDFCGGYKAGDEFEVIHCNGEVVTFIDRDGDTRYLRHGRIKPVPVAEATGTAAASAQDDEPKFKVGDRVRFTDETPEAWWFGPHTKHNEGVVAEVDEFGRVKTVQIGADGIGYMGGLGHLLRPASLQIQAGRHYHTRDGRKVGPATPSGDTDYPWRVGESWYTDSGAWLDGMEDDNDLVAEADEPPVAVQQAGGTGYGSTAGFTVPLCAYEDEPGWYATELGRAYADGYAAGLRASQTQAA